MPPAIYVINYARSVVDMSAGRGVDKAGFTSRRFHAHRNELLTVFAAEANTRIYLVSILIRSEKIFSARSTFKRDRLVI